VHKGRVARRIAGSPRGRVRTLSPPFRVPAAALGMLSLLGLVALAGCQLVRPLTHNTLHVVVVPSDKGSMQADPEAHIELAAPVLEAFRRLHPGVHVRLQVVQEDRIEPELEMQRRRGLGPDLLLVRAPVAVALLRRGLVDPVPRDRSLADTLLAIRPGELQRVREDGRLAGLPVVEEVSLACFDRRKAASPPSDLKGLLALAASGRTIGVSVDPIGIWWSAGSLGAAEPLALMLTDHPIPPGRDLDRDRLLVEGWLRWLRQAALQSRVDIASGPDELLAGLTSGRLAWIPCYSLNLFRLQQQMGPRLGVAPLPAGPEGQASPFSSLRVWAFGTDSSRHQRQLAVDLARFTLTPKQQRELTLVSQSLMPVNRYVSIPVAESGRLAAMATAQDQFRQVSAALVTPFSADRVRRLLPPFEQILYEVMVGVVSPEQGARQLLDLRKMP